MCLNCQHVTALGRRTNNDHDFLYLQNFIVLIKTGVVGWCDGPGKLPVPGRPTILMIVGLGPIALAVGAGGEGVVWTFLLSSILSLFFLHLSGRRSNID